MSYDDEYITISLTEDECNIISEMLSKIDDTSGMSIGFDITLDTLKEKFCGC